MMIDYLASLSGHHADRPAHPAISAAVAHGLRAVARSILLALGYLLFFLGILSALPIFLVAWPLCWAWRESGDWAGRYTGMRGETCEGREV